MHSMRRGAQAWLRANKLAPLWMLRLDYEAQIGRDLVELVKFGLLAGVGDVVQIRVDERDDLVLVDRRNVPSRVHAVSAIRDFIFG